MGKQLLELGKKLGGQGLVGGNDQGGPLDLGHDMGHGKGLARAGDSQQQLAARPAGKAAHQCCYGLRLVAGRGKGGDEFKGTIHKENDLLGFKFLGLDGKIETAQVDSLKCAFACAKAGRLKVKAFQP